MVRSRLPTPPPPGAIPADQLEAELRKVLEVELTLLQRDMELHGRTYFYREALIKLHGDLRNALQETFIRHPPRPDGMV